MLFRSARKDKNQEVADAAYAIFKENYPYFGYGYIKDPYDLVPDVSTVFYSFRIMVYCGLFFFVFFIFTLIYSFKNRMDRATWLQWIGLCTFPLAYLAGHAGWIVAEMGRQPWAIQDILPTGISVSRLSTSSVQLTFFLFLILFTVMLIAEIGIMVKVIKKGPDALDDKSI